MRKTLIICAALASGCATNYEPSSSVAWTRDDISYEERGKLFQSDLAICQAEAVKVASGAGSSTNIAYFPPRQTQQVDLGRSYMQAAMVQSMREQTAMQSQIVNATIRGCLYERGWHETTITRSARQNCIDDNWPNDDSGMTAAIRASRKGKCDRYEQPNNQGD